jgi:hypothetical protein
MTKPTHFGIASLPGGGQDLAGGYLADMYGHLHLTTRDILHQEADRLNLPTDQETLSHLTSDLQQRNESLGILIVKGFERWEKQKASYVGGLAISGISTVAEAKVLKKRGILLYIDAPQDLRYEWLRARNREFDAMTREQFAEIDRNERDGLIGPNRPQLREVSELADITIPNNGTVDEFMQRIDYVVGKYDQSAWLIL